MVKVFLSPASLSLVDIVKSMRFCFLTVRPHIMAKKSIKMKTLERLIARIFIFISKAIIDDHVLMFLHFCKVIFHTVLTIVRPFSIVLNFIFF